MGTIEYIEEIIPAPKPPPTEDELPYEDGIPMESDWHRAAMNLLIEVISHLWRGRKDYYVGGNMFIYFDPDQVRTRNFRGPDFFVVKNIEDNSRWRKSWVVWQEDGRGPNVVIELASTSTWKVDVGPKKAVYEQILRVPEYYCYNPDTQELQGWRLVAGNYVSIKADEAEQEGRLWSEEIGAWLGLWSGKFLGRPNTWLRFFDPDGGLLLTETEATAQRAEAAAQRAETEAKARRQAEAEVERLKAQLAALGQTDDNDSDTQETEQ